MAHECPECFQTCYCGGDIDDCLINEGRAVLVCTCCETSDEDEADWDWDNEEK